MSGLALLFFSLGLGCLRETGYSAFVYQKSYLESHTICGVLLALIIPVTEWRCLHNSGIQLADLLWSNNEAVSFNFAFIRINGNV